MAALPLRSMVLFSSTAALFGAPGQGNYAAANAALEAWATRYAASGQLAVAVQWGAWAAGVPLFCLDLLIAVKRRPVAGASLRPWGKQFLWSFALSRGIFARF